MLSTTPSQTPASNQAAPGRARLMGLVVAAVVGIGWGQTFPPLERLRPFVEHNCLLCLIRFDLDMAGCESTDELDEEAARCREWARRELRTCYRGCDRNDETVTNPLYQLWFEGRITTDDLVAILYGED